MSETVPEFCHWFATAPQFWLNVQLKQSAQTLSHFHQFILAKRNVELQVDPDSSTWDNDVHY
jgi:plasmid maintenance system antidote protein VapI